MPPLSVWLSPWEDFNTPDQISNALSGVHLPDHYTEVLIPTVYDDTPQYYLRNNLGAALKVSTVESARNLRQQFQSLGLACGGWSVPRGTGNATSEGHIHGAFASVFDHFNLNWEEGWQDFWAREGAAPVNQFLTGFWDELIARGRSDITVGITFVANTAMLGAASPQETAAWVEGSHYVAVETYLPGDPGLDPAFGKARMLKELAEAGHPDFPIVNLLEHGDLPTLAAQHSHPTYGVQVWTVGAAASNEWPVPTTPSPVTEPTVPELLNALSYIKGDVITPLRSYADDQTKEVVAEIDRVCAQYGVV